MLRGYLIAVLVSGLLFCRADFVLADSADNGEGTREQKILRIQQLIENRDFHEADRLLAEATKQFPADPGLQNLRGVIAAQQGNYQSAEESFNRAVRRAPKFTNAYLNLGRLYQERAAADPRTLRKALSVYGRVLRYDAKNAEANYQSAVLLLQLGEFQNSLNHLAQLPVRSQGSAQTLSILCADYAGLGNRTGADDVAAQLLANPEFSEADAAQALPGLTAGGRDDLSISLLEALESRTGLSPEMQHALGLAFERAGRLVEARATLEKFAMETNLSVPGLLELARIAHKQQDYQGALGYLAHARDLEPNNAKLHYYFGLVCVDMNLIAEARNSFEKAVKLEPENPSYNYAMGATSAYRHDPAEAVPYFEKYLKLKPQDPRAKLALGNALFRAKDYDAAIPWLTEALKTPETAATAHYYLGSIALQERRPDEAFHELGQALKAQPNYADALAELGQYFVMQRDYAQAEKQIRRALQIDPDHFAANFYLLTLYTRTTDSRREEQAKRFEELQKLRDEKTQEFLRIVEVRPFDTP
jgi:tetratricopeptide (TPR) repeat protein